MSILSTRTAGLLVALIVIGLIGSSCTAVPTTMETPAQAPAPLPDAGVMSALPGSGPDLAMRPTDQWMELGSGQYHWYAFTFDFDEDYTQPVEVRLFSEPEDAAILTIRNTAQADLWRRDGEHEHFGCCVVQEFAEDDETPYAVWAGAMEASGTYYIVVEHAKDIAETANYRFELMGQGISFPDGLMEPMAFAPTQPVAPAEEEPMMESAMTVGEGMGPDEAMVPPEGWVALDEGEYHWYTFTYDFDEDYTNPVEIRIFSEPSDGAVLTVRNMQQADLWRTEGEHEHFGCCSVQTIAEDEDTPYAVWSGALESSGTYYIVVEHAKNVTGPAYYQFSLNGDGVSY